MVSLGSPVTFVQMNIESRNKPSSKIRQDSTLAPANFRSSFKIFPLDLNTVIRLRKYATRTARIQQTTLLIASLSEISFPKASNFHKSGTNMLKSLKLARLTTVVMPPLTTYMKILRSFSCCGVRCSPPTTIVFNLINYSILILFSASDWPCRR